MKNALQISFRTAAVTLLVTGIMYPYLVMGVAHILFPSLANGSLVRKVNGRVIGSKLIAQRFTNPAYFHPRPSAAGDEGYDGASSSGSNLGPTSKKLRDRVTEELKRLKEENPDAPEAVPAELVTTSASGLDPHITPKAALWQVPRVARTRKAMPDAVKSIVDGVVEGRILSVFGEPRINVLMLNLALDVALGPPRIAEP